MIELACTTGSIDDEEPIEELVVLRVSKDDVEYELVRELWMDDVDNVLMKELEKL